VDEARRTQVLLAMAMMRRTDPAGRSTLCALSAGIVAVSGAGVTVMSRNGDAGMTVCSSDPIAQAIGDLQFSLGEGPSFDSYNTEQPLGEPDLAHVKDGRWAGFAPAAVSAGAAAVFGFPLRASGVVLGALDLYRDRVGERSQEQFADALVVADVIAQEILVLQAGAPAGTVGVRSSGGSELRLVVHQATGMVAAQLDIGVYEAMDRLRARAYAEDVSLTDLAVSVVDRGIRFGPDWPL
jgi:hypothetical protein